MQTMRLKICPNGGITALKPQQINLSIWGMGNTQLACAFTLRSS